jgi:hypothetical protein
MGLATARFPEVGFGNGVWLPMAPNGTQRKIVTPELPGKTAWLFGPGTVFRPS